MDLDFATLDRAFSQLLAGRDQITDKPQPRSVHKHDFFKYLARANCLFSGSVVFDKTNSSGFGTAENPPMVAMYTSLLKADGIQRQALAYSPMTGRPGRSTRATRSSTSHSTNFRDPKVFWYAPDPRAGGWWWRCPTSTRCRSTARPT